MTVTQPSPSPASWCPELTLADASAVNTERHHGIYVVGRPTQHHPRAYPAYVTSWGYVIPVWGFVVAPSSKLISTWGGSGGHILACDTLICLLDMRSKNMSTSQRTFIQTIHWSAVHTSTTNPSNLNWTWWKKRRSRSNWTKILSMQKSKPSKLIYGVGLEWFWH